MWKNNELLLFAWEKKGEEMIFAAFLFIMAAVYFLYDLPDGPLVYTSVLTTALFAAAWIVGFRRWKKKCRQLSGILEEKYREIDSLPKWDTQAEQFYQELYRRTMREKAEAEEKIRKEKAEADLYYTRWSHQIKTPLSVMRLLVQEPSADQEAMRRELVKTEQYIEMALNYQKLGKEGKDLRFDHFLAESLVKQAAVRTASFFIQKKLAFVMGDGLDCDILTDEKWFVFILEQIFTNAVKYTKKGSVTVYAKEPGVVVVEDTGIGILLEDLPRIFEWGYTGYNGRLDKRSTGIGLSLVKRTCDLLGHRISVESQVGKGTKVVIDTRKEAVCAE